MELFDHRLSHLAASIAPGDTIGELLPGREPFGSVGPVLEHLGDDVGGMLDELLGIGGDDHGEVCLIISAAFGECKHLGESCFEISGCHWPRCLIDGLDAELEILDGWTALDLVSDEIVSTASDFPHRRRD